MATSFKKIYQQEGIFSPVVSVRHNHAQHKGLPNSLRKSHQIMKTPNKGNGFDCGCRKSNSLKVVVIPKVFSKEFGEVVPSWVSASKRSKTTLSQVRTIRGVLTESRISGTDFPFKPWHEQYDWNYFVKTDPQFFYLQSPANGSYNVKNKSAIMECEWDTKFVPLWSLPMPGDRIQITGRWIFDCGHPINGKHRSELHPPKAVISFRDETAKFSGNKGFSRASQAIVYINGKGGYYNQKINDQNYSFDIYLPPKPSAASKPKFITKKKIASKVNPIITPFPKENPKLLRVTIPLKGKSASSYGIIISGGWSDPTGADAKQIRKVEVNISEANLKSDKDPNRIINRADEWYLYTGINGRWKFFKSMDRGKRKLNHKVTLRLHKSQKIKISSNGYEADPIHDLMGKSTGLSSKIASASNLRSADRKKAGKAIRNGFLSLGSTLTEGASIENDRIGIVNHSLKSISRINNKVIHSSKKDYTLKISVK